MLAGGRLVTLTGPGGAGKTRLAATVARSVADRYDDGAYFVELAPVSDRTDLVPAILAAMGLREADIVVRWESLPRDLVDRHHGAEGAEKGVRATAMDRLVEVISGRQILLVLDNCEHLIDSVAGIVTRLLEAVPGLRVLATSREALAIPAELHYPVPSLALPPPEARAAEALDFAAVQLFADRGCAANPDFRVEDSNVAAVVAICRALDGIPLALELAAARLRSMSPQQIADRLADRFGLLTVGNRAALPRQQTLRAVVDWSWDLLGETERAVLRRLGMFAAGATADAAAVVCDVADALDVLASLVDKSLVIAVPAPAGQRRYRLLETVRAYALMRLNEAPDGGEATAARRRHADYFLAFAELANPKLRTREQFDWLDLLIADHENLRTALRYLIDARVVPEAVRLAHALSWYWMLRGLKRDTAEWSAAVCEIVGAEPPPDLGPEYLAVRFTRLLSSRDAADLPPVRALLERELAREKEHANPMLGLVDMMIAMFGDGLEAGLARIARWQPSPDPWTAAMLDTMAGHLELNFGRLRRGSQQLATAEAQFRALGDSWGVMLVLAGVHEVALLRGDYGAALDAMQEACGYAVRFGDADDQPMWLARRGLLRWLTGDEAGGYADLDIAIAATTRLGKGSEGAAMAYQIRGEIAHRAGDLDEADRWYRRALQVGGQPEEFMAIGGGHLQAITATRRGLIAEQRGDLAGARELQQEALRYGYKTQDGPLMSACADGAASLLAAEGDFPQAAVFVGAAHAMRGAPGADALCYPRVTDAIVAAIGSAAYRRAYQRGRGLDRDELLALEASAPG